MSLPGSLAQHLRQLQAQGLPRLEAQMLVLHAVGQRPDDRAWLISHDERVLTSEQADELERCSRRRLDGEPMAYLLGMKEFHGLPLQVDAHVLDPRDDTETLVDWALEVLSPDQPNEVLDLGTGSGAISFGAGPLPPRLAGQRDRRQCRRPVGGAPQWRTTGADRLLVAGLMAQTLCRAAL